MARYTIEFGALGDSRPVPDLTVQTTDLNVLDRAVAAHARPHITPVLAELGRPELADCLFRMNRDRTMGQFLYLNLAAGTGAEFLLARITTTPERIQRKRTAGWTSNGAKYVGRGTRWGNPFRIGHDADDQTHATALYREWLESDSYAVHAPSSSIEQRREMDDHRDWIITHATELAGRDLMCWCAPELPCHADVLLELANCKPAPTPAP